MFLLRIPSLKSFRQIAELKWIFKMSCVAHSCFKQRAVIEFWVNENESVVNIHKRSCAVYGSCAVDRSTVGRWAKRVKASGSAETELCDLPHVGRPATANTSDMLNRVDSIIHADRRITMRQFALQLSISTGSVYSVIEKYCSSMTLHALTQAWEPRNTSPKWVGRCCPIHPTAQIWLRWLPSLWVS
jgi:hypothetical protein